MENCTAVPTHAEAACGVRQLRPYVWVRRARYGLPQSEVAPQAADGRLRSGENACETEV